MTQPIRIQRKRTKGWKMPENTVYVGRPGLFGNPFYSRPDAGPRSFSFEVWMFRRWLYKSLGLTILENPKAVELSNFIEKMATPFCEKENDANAERIKQALPLLRGMNLACWCPLDQPCHADVLLELANKGNNDGEIPAEGGTT